MKTYHKPAQQSGPCEAGLRKDLSVNEIELSPKINPHIYSQLIFFTEVPRQFNGEGIVFSTNAAGTIGLPPAEE